MQKAVLVYYHILIQYKNVFNWMLKNVRYIYNSMQLNIQGFSIVFKEE